MRKPLLALGLVLSTGFGALPVANAVAATPRPGSPTPSSSSPPSAPSNAHASPSPSRVVSGADIVRTAMKYLGFPYTATGNSPSTGFSCIGFVSYVYRQNGISLPGDLGGALAYAPRVSFASLVPGDIMYFQNTVWAGLSHAAIYIGGGKLIHAEYYGRGVTITSFTNDATDGNYWPAKYLTSNRPWTGAAVGSVISTAPTTPSTGANGPSSVVGVVPTSQIPNGPQGTVTAAQGLYLRSAPSKNSATIRVVPKGATVNIVGTSGTWYKVQLADGTVGWMDSHFVSKGGSSADSVGNPTAPARVASPGASRRQSVITVKTTTLYVRSNPSSGAPVVGIAGKGQTLHVLGSSHGWYKVRLPDGTIGWVSASYVAGHKPSAGSTRATSAAGKGPRSTANAALNVRSGPGFGKPVVTVIPVGGSYQIMSWSHGWAKVRLPNGTIGWVSGTVTASPSPSYSSRANARGGSRTRASRSTKSARLTTGVRMHTAPGAHSPVVGLAAAGTRVKVLGHKSGWTLVRLPNGTTGYVLGTYVH